ncbi:hypothetical protein [Brachybacterium sp. UMB0905]|nr:hypothetical protein [Brachybacterium sp. UMB0905]
MGFVPYKELAAANGIPLRVEAIAAIVTSFGIAVGWLLVTSAIELPPPE